MADGAPVPSPPLGASVLSLPQFRPCTNDCLLLRWEHRQPIELCRSGQSSNRSEKLGAPSRDGSKGGSIHPLSIHHTTRDGFREVSDEEGVPELEDLDEVAKEAYTDQKPVASTLARHSTLPKQVGGGTSTSEEGSVEEKSVAHEGA